MCDFLERYGCDTTRQLQFHLYSAIPCDLENTIIGNFNHFSSFCGFINFYLGQVCPRVICSAALKSALQRSTPPGSNFVLATARIPDVRVDHADPVKGSRAFLLLLLFLYSALRWGQLLAVCPTFPETLAASLGVLIPDSFLRAPPLWIGPLR